MSKRCKICGKSFPTDIALKRHLRENHGGYYYGIRLAPVIAVIILLAAILVISPPKGMTVTITSQTTSTAISTIISPTTSIHTAGAQSSRKPELPEVDELGLTGRKVNISQFSGKPIFLEFMSPTCGHCERMAPIIKGLYEKYGDRVIFISISMRLSPYMSNEQLVSLTADFIKKHESGWLHLIDADWELAAEYDVTGTPTYIILDKNHVEVERIVGEKSKDVLEKAILSILS